MIIRKMDKIPRKALTVDEELLTEYSYSKKVGNYLIGKSIGHGSFAKVRESLHTVTGEKVAMKIIDKEKCKSDSYVRRNLRREGRILQQLRHPNVIKMFEILETEHHYYLVLELCGKDLMTHILQQGRLDEATTKANVAQLILALEYLHKAGVLHRDLKVENILLTEQGSLKVIDFGLSTQVRSFQSSNGQLVTDLCRTQCGSPAYAAPEILAKKAYCHKADIWSIGVNMFAMLVGSLPFSVQPFNLKELCNKMMTKNMNPIPVEISKECHDLLHRFLDPDPERRISLSEALEHPWFRNDPFDVIPSPLISENFPNPYSTGDFNSDIIQYMVAQLGFCKTEVTRLLMGNLPSSTSAVYHLLVQKVIVFQQQQHKKIQFSTPLAVEKVEERECREVSKFSEKISDEANDSVNTEMASNKENQENHSPMLPPSKRGRVLTSAVETNCPSKKINTTEPGGDEEQWAEVVTPPCDQQNPRSEDRDSGGHLVVPRGISGGRGVTLGGVKVVTSLPLSRPQTCNVSERDSESSNVNLPSDSDMKAPKYRLLRRKTGKPNSCVVVAASDAAVPFSGTTTEKKKAYVVNMIQRDRADIPTPVGAWMTKPSGTSPMTLFSRPMYRPPTAGQSRCIRIFPSVERLSTPGGGGGPLTARRMSHLPQFSGELAAPNAYHTGNTMVGQTQFAGWVARPRTSVKTGNTQHSRANQHHQQAQRNGEIMASPGDVTVRPLARYLRPGDRMASTVSSLRSQIYSGGIN